MLNDKQVVSKASLWRRRRGLMAGLAAVGALGLVTGSERAVRAADTDPVLQGSSTGRTPGRPSLTAWRCRPARRRPPSS